MNLTKNFTLEELIESDTAKRLHIDNTPNDSAVKNLRKLCEYLLQPARDKCGYPLKISSGYRCRRLNEKVGGAANSYHLYGMAADIPVNSMAEGMALARLFLTMRQCDLAILERKKKSLWVHVQWSHAPRHKLITLSS